jgi:hypothetical protein
MKRSEIQAQLCTTMPYWQLYAAHSPGALSPTDFMEQRSAGATLDAFSVHEPIALIAS